MSGVEDFSGTGGAVAAGLPDSTTDDSGFSWKPNPGLKRPRAQPPDLTHSANTRKSGSNFVPSHGGIGLLRRPNIEPGNLRFDDDCGLPPEQGSAQTSDPPDLDIEHQPNKAARRALPNSDSNTQKGDIPLSLASTQNFDRLEDSMRFNCRSSAYEKSIPAKIDSVNKTKPPPSNYKIDALPMLSRTPDPSSTTGPGSTGKSESSSTCKTGFKLKPLAHIHAPMPDESQPALPSLPPPSPKHSSEGKEQISPPSQVRNNDPINEDQVKMPSEAKDAPSNDHTFHVSEGHHAASREVAPSTCLPEVDRQNVATSAKDLDQHAVKDDDQHCMIHYEKARSALSRKLVPSLRPPETHHPTVAPQPNDNVDAAKNDEQQYMVPYEKSGNEAVSIPSTSINACNQWLNKDRIQAMQQLKQKASNTQQIEESLTQELEQMQIETKRILQDELEFAVRICSVRGQCLLNQMFDSTQDVARISHKHNENGIQPNHYPNK